MLKTKYTLSILIICLLLINCGDKKNETSKTKPAKTEKQAEPKKEEKAAEVKEEVTEKVEPKEEVKPEKEVKTEPESEPMTQEQLDKASEIIKSVSSSAIAAVNAKKVFKMRCATCHGFKGNLKLNGAKDLTKSNISMEESVAQVYFGKGLMTPFKGLMKDEEIVAVTKYIREKLKK